MTGYLTTHVLDTARGCPAEGITITLYRVIGNSHRKIAEAVTNTDGRTDAPMLSEKDFKTGNYELTFNCQTYFDDCGVRAESPRFLSEIPIRFGMAEPSHYHVPLLLSPFGYSTYRGS